MPWEDDVYLKPFMEDDSLLHSLSIDDDDDEDEDCGMSMERGQCSAGNGVLAEPPGNTLRTISERNGSDISPQFHQECTVGSTQGEDRESLAHEMNDSHLKVARASVNAKAIKTVDDNYFGSYSSFGIHREMLGDKVGELFLDLWPTSSCQICMSIHVPYVFDWSENTECSG